MLVLRVAGVILVSVGVLSGVSLLVAAAGLNLSVSIEGFWFFYLVSFIGGFILYALGSKVAPTEKLFKVAGGILVIIGLSAAVSLLLSGVQLLAPSDVGQLWALFLLCLPLGVLATLAAEAEARQHALRCLQKEFGRAPRRKSRAQGSSLAQKLERKPEASEETADGKREALHELKE